MDFGIGGYRTFRFVPTFGGNREALPCDQVSCEIIRPTVAERLAHDGEDEAVLYVWRDAHLAKWLDDPELGPPIKAMGVAVLTVLRSVVTHTRDWRGITIDGRPLTDPAEICLHAPIPDTGQRPLVREVYDAIQRASALTGSELGNFVSQCGGPPAGTTLRQMDAPTAPTPVDLGTAPGALTPEVPSA